MAIPFNNHVFKGHRALLGNKYVTYAEIELPTREELCAFSTHGFDWGNGGKSAQQLAFSMLAQLSDATMAQKYAKQFTEDVIIKLNGRDWILSAPEVLEWIEKHYDLPKNETHTLEQPKPLNKLPKIAKKQKSNIIKDICKELGITQKTLAKILEVPEGTVSSWAVKNEIPRLGKKAIEFYMLNVKNQKIVDSYRNFKELIENS